MKQYFLSLLILSAPCSHAIRGIKTTGQVAAKKHKQQQLKSVRKLELIKKRLDTARQRFALEERRNIIQEICTTDKAQFNKLSDEFRNINITISQLKPTTQPLKKIKPVSPWPSLAQKQPRAIEPPLDEQNLRSMKDELKKLEKNMSINYNKFFRFLCLERSGPMYH